MPSSTLWVFLFFCVLYAGVTRGHFISTDEVLAYEATSSLWQEGVPAVRTTENSGVAGRDRYIYSVVSSGQSVAVLPLYALGRVVGSALGPRASRLLAGPSITRNQLVWGGEVELFFVDLWNALVTAALCAVFFAFLLRLGVGPPWSLLTTLLLGTTSYVVGYSSTFFTQSVEAFGLLGTFFLLFLDRENPDARLRVAAGLLVAFTLQCRYPALILVPGLLVYQGFTAYKRSGGGIPALAREMAPLVLGVLLGLGLHAADQLWKFGTIYSKGGYEKARWHAPVLTGLRGLLLSPGASIFVYTPLLLLTPFAFPSFFRRHRAEAAFVLGQTALYLVIFSTFPNWHGLWCFGPRYMVPVIPLLMLPLGAWLETHGRRAWPVVAMLALTGLWVQAVHLLANFWSVFVQGGYMDFIKSYEYAAGSTIPGDFLFDWRYSPVLAQSKAVLAWDGRVDMWFVWLWRQVGLVGGLTVMVPWLLLLGWCGVRTWRAVRGVSERFPPRSLEDAPSETEGCETVAEPAANPSPSPRSLARTGFGAAVLIVAFTATVRVALPGSPLYQTVTLPRVSELDPSAAMNEAVDLLYQKKAPAAALLILEKVLAENPDHYGANFQKARALDALGQPSIDQWRRALVLAERVHDEGTARLIRARLGVSQ